MCMYNVGIITVKLDPGSVKLFIRVIHKSNIEARTVVQIQYCIAKNNVYVYVYSTHYIKNYYYNYSYQLLQ